MMSNEILYPRPTYSKFHLFLMKFERKNDHQITSSWKIHIYISSFKGVKNTKKHCQPSHIQIEKGEDELISPFNFKAAKTKKY